MGTKRQRGKTRYHGLKNQGATCYLNSVLQVLYMTKDFRKAVKGSNSSQDSHGCIDYQLRSVFNALTKNTESTQEITNYLGIKKVNEQHDAAECFDKILSCSSSKASEIFQGVLTHKNTCSKCEDKTESNSPFWSLPLTLNETECYPVTDAVQKYFQESKLCGENQLYCNTCNDKTDSSIKLEMHHHPDVLTLLLKRFKFDYHYMDYVKIKCSVQVPYTLEIPTTTNKTQRYQLYAYVEHSGELRSGHYTAEIKSEEDGQWYSFNDSTVTMNRYQQFQLDMKEKIPRAYLLFYKKTTDSLDADSCGASTPGCFKSDVETPQREGGEKAAARIDNKGVEDETKNREIKTSMGVRDKQSEMTGTNDDRLMSTNNKCSKHRKLSEINTVLNVRPDIDGQSRDKPQNDSEKTNDLQQNPETVQNKIKNKKKVPNDKRSKKVVDDHHNDCDQLHCKQDVSDSLSENSPKDLSFKQKETKRSDQRRNEGKKPEGHCTETGTKHQILSLANANEDGLKQEEQHSKNYDEVRKVENSETLQKIISTSSPEGQEGKEEKPQNDKSFQGREKSEQLIGESESNQKTVQHDKDTQNNLQGDVHAKMNSVTQELAVKIDTNPQNNTKNNDGETSHCFLMQNQKDLLEQQHEVQTESSTENIPEVSPDVIQQEAGSQSGKKKKQKKGQNKRHITLAYGSSTS